MAAQHQDDKRNTWAPQPMSALLPGLLRPAFHRRSLAAVQLITDWQLIVGPALSAVTAPQRLAAGTLTIRCAGPVAIELAHMTSELLARINGHLGRVAVERLRFVQGLAAAPHAASPPPRPAAAVMIDGVSPGPLHDALARLGAAVERAARPP